MAKVKEEGILIDVYNLILNLETEEEERKILVDFKREVEGGKDFEASLQTLAEDLRKLAVKNLQDKKTLSKEVGDFYQKIKASGLFEKNLAAGLMSYGIVR